MHECEPSFRRLELHRRDSEIGQNSAHLGDVTPPEQSLQISKASRNQTDPVPERSQTSAGDPERLWRISVGPGWSSFAVAGNLLAEISAAAENGRPPSNMNSTIRNVRMFEPSGSR